MKKLQAFFSPKNKKITRKPQDVAFPHHHPAYVIATWFWSGRLSPAPGTWGTLASIPFWWAFFALHSFVGYITALIGLFICGAVAIEHIERKVGKKKSHDASLFVVDEVLGMGVTLLPLALMGSIHLPVWAWWGIAFILFRFFDIVKIPPARQVDQGMHNGWGVMLDDAIAGLYAAVTLAAIQTAFVFWYINTTSSTGQGTDGELCFFLGLFLIPLGTVFALLAAIPWAYKKVRTKRRKPL